MKIKKIKISEIKERVKNLPRLLAEKAFFTFLGLFCIILITSALFYYKYVISAEHTGLDTIEQSLQLKEGIFQEISNKISERDKSFKDADNKTYPNLFAKPTAMPPLTP